MMHAVMMTSQPLLMYWAPATLLIMQTVSQLRRSGLAAAFTLDAGPNVHVITTVSDHEKVRQELASLPGVQQVIASAVGSAAKNCPK